MRPDLLKLIGNKEEEKAKVNNYINNMTVKGFNTDESTKFLNMESFQEYINPENISTSGFAFGSNIEQDRAFNQSNWEQTGRTLTKLIPKTALEFMSQVGNVLDFEDYANSDNEVGNWLNTWAQKQKQNIDEALPVYRENPDKALDIGDYAWWVQNGSSLIESATAFVGLGYLTGGASLRLLNNGGKALEWLKIIGKGATTTDKAQKGIRLVSGLTNALALNQAEGVGIAANVYDTVYTKELAKLKKENKDISDKEADKQARVIAAQKASSVVNFNRSNILLNLTSSFAFLKTPLLTRQLRKAPSLKRSFKTALHEGLQEAGEETINLVAEKQALDDNYSFDKAIRDIATKEGAESAILGFVGGAGQTALTNAGRTIKINRDNEGNRFSRNDRQQASFEQQQQSKTRIEAIDKATKLSDVTDAYLKANETFELYRELEEASNKGDFDKVQEISNTLLSTQAYDAFTNGTTDQLLNVFKGIKVLDEDVAEEKGLDKKTYKQDSDRAIKRIENLETEFNKANTYLNFNEVYDNRARNLAARDNKDTLEKALQEEKETLLKDLSDLGIKEDVITFSETGGISFNNFNKYGATKKEALNNLKSLQEYKDTKKQITAIATNIKKLSELHTKLTSDEEQTRITNVIKEERRKNKEQAANDKIERKQRKEADKATKVAKDLERKLQETEDTTDITDTVEDNKAKTQEEDIPPAVDKIPNIKDIPTIGFTFKSNNKVFEEKANTLINSDLSVNKKIEEFENYAEILEKNIEAPNVSGALSQIRNAVRSLKGLEEDTKIKEETSNISEEKAKRDIREALEDLDPISEEDEGLNEDERKLVKQQRLINIAFKSMEEAGIDITSFPNVAEFVQEAIGRSKFVRIFDQVRALYNLAKVGNSSSATYSDIFYDNTTRKNIIENKETIDASKVFAEIYANSDLDFNKNENNALKDFTEQQGYSVYKGDKVINDDVKIIEGYKTLAHLDKKYRTKIKVTTTNKFNVLDFVPSKVDLDNELNENVSHIALDYDKFGEGSKIDFIVLDEVLYEDGSITYADGRVESNGVITQKDPIDFAPIGALFNGEVLQGQYLHTVEWINENNIAEFKDVKRQKRDLRTIREAIIEAGKISTTIDTRTNGHFMRDFNGVYNKVSKNLPNVEIAIGKDNILFTGENTSVETDNKIIVDAKVYAVMPVNKNTKFGVPIKRDKLSEYPKYVESILQAVRLYLDNNPNEERAIKLREKTHIDITKINGLREYMEKFLFLNPALDNASFKFNTFKTYVTNNVREDASIIRILTDPNNPNVANIEFGRGANVGNTIRFINRDIINKLEASERYKTIEALLGRLENVLNNNTRINIVKNNLKKQFQLPLISQNDVTITEQPYNDFVKDHTTTDLYSYTLDDGKGKEIYTIQPNFEFDVTFAFKPRVVEETKDAPIKDIEVDVEEVTGFDPYEDLEGFSEDDLDPKTLTKEQQEEFEANIPKSLFVKGVSINLQDVIINHLTANILKNRFKEDNKEDAFDAIDIFANTLNNVYLPKYEQAIENADTEEKKNKASNNLKTTKNIIKEYNKISYLVVDNLRQYHNIIKKGSKLEEIKQELEDEVYNFDSLVDDEGELGFNSWESDKAFTTDFKRQVGQEVRNYFSYIEDVKTIDNNNIAIPKKLFGLPITIPFDQVFDELSAILAYNNNQEEANITVPTYKSMINTIKEWVEVKPYLHNVLIELENASEEIRNKFITVMSKSYTHHLFTLKKRDGTSYVNSSDSNNIIGMLQSQWLSNIYDSNLISIEDNNYIVNEQEVLDINVQSKKLITLMQDVNSEPENVLNDASILLHRMGFKFPKKLVSILINEGVVYNKKRFNLLGLLTGNSDGAFKVYIDRLNSIKGLNSDENNPFANNSALNKFARQIAKLYPINYTNAFKDVKGKTYYGYSANKFLTDRTKVLKTNAKGILQKLSKQPFSKTSYWVKQFLNNPKFKKHFGYFTFDGSKQGFIGKKLKDMTPAEIEEQKLILFFSQNKKGKNYILNLFYPTTSDKSVPYGLTVLGNNWNDTINPNTGKIGNKRLEWLYEQIVSPEINRILSIQDTPERWNIEAYKEGGTMFNFIPSLNSIKEIWIEEGSIRKLNIAIAEKNNLRNALKEELQSFINRLVDNKLQEWENNGFIEEKESTRWRGNISSIVKEKRVRYDLENTAHNTATNFVLNYLIANINIYQTFTTDPAFYWKSGHWENVAKRVLDNDNTIELPINRKETLKYYSNQDWLQEHEDLFNNMGKRLGADSAPGDDTPNSPNETFTLGIIADDIKPSYLYEYYKGLLKNKAEKYFTVNHTDAQELTTLKEHLHLMQLEGEITKEQVKQLVFKDDNNITLEEEDLKVIYQPTKPVYVNNIWTDGVEHRIYIKSSSFPLYKQLTKGLEIDNLRRKMIKDGIDRIAFKSAVKIGSVVSPKSIFESNKIKKNLQIDTKVLPRDGFKIQQKLPYKENVNTINDGTQQRKLLTAAVRDYKAFKLTKKSKELVTGQRIEDELNKNYNELFKIGYNALINELGFNVESGTINIQKLQKILIDEALSRQYPLYDIEALGLKNDTFIVPLWLINVSGKLEAMLNSIVDNRIRKLTPKGKSYVLGSNVGFKVIEGQEVTDFIENTKGIVYDTEFYNREDKTLLSTRVEDITGKLRGEEGFDEATATGKPAEILVPFKFKDDKGNILKIEDFIIKGNLIDITKLPSNLLELFGFRIPTHLLNSMSYIKIVGFLPERSGDLVLVPSDWAVQMGSDFDFDKLFTNTYNTSYTDGKLERYKGNDRVKQIENNILDLHYSILTSPDERVQALIVEPLGHDELLKVIDDVYISENEGIGVSEQYQTNKYINARAAKLAISLFSMNNTFLSSLQGKNIVLQKRVKKGWIPYSFELGGQRSNSITDLQTNNKSNTRTKFEISTALQNLALDNENEQGLHKLNVNKHTFNVINTLMLKGFEEDIIFYFLNQPIIKKYIELKIKSEDTTIKYDEEQINIDINQLYPLSDNNIPENVFFNMYANPSKEELLSMVKGLTSSNDVQKALYLRFIELEQYGKSLQSVQSAINTDSSGLGKDLFYSSAKQTQILNLDKNDIVKGANTLIGDYLTLQNGQGDTFDSSLSIITDTDINSLEKDWYNNILTNEQKKDILKKIQKAGFIPVGATTIEGDIKDTIKFIKPTTINGFASVYALLLNNHIWNQEDFFPYNINSIISVTESIKNSINKKGDAIQSQANINKKIFSHIKSYLITKFPNIYTNGEVFEERQRLFVADNNNRSITHIVNTLKETGKLRNAFINRLSPDLREVLLPSNITYNAAATERINERSVYAAVSQMLTDDITDLGEFNGINYTPKKVMQDLITHQLLAGGIQKAKQFIKYIPINYLKAIGYYDSINNINLLNEDEFNPVSFKYQYIQHYPREVELSDKKNLNTNYSFYNNNTIIRANKGTKEELPFYFSIINLKAVSGYDLYVKDITSSNWKQIDTLGYKNIFEYDASKVIGKSMIPSNQVPEVKEITVPKTEKETEDFLKIHKQVSNDSETIYDPDTASLNDYFNLQSDETSLNKISYILGKIVDNSNNKYRSFLAQELHNNLDKIKDYRFIVDTSLKSKGSHNINDKTIKINPKEISNIDAFENTILEEVLHAFTKKALISNENDSNVERLKAIRLQAKQIVRRKLGKGADIKFATTQRKIDNKIPLNIEEYELIYPVLTDVEFVGRLFKSEKLQQLLNDTPSNVKDRNTLEKIWDIIVDLLNSIGIDIKKGSALEYATIDIISLINQPPPSTFIQGEIKKAKKVIRTVDFINDKFDLKDDSGKNNIIENSQEVVDWVNDNVSNLIAYELDGIIVIENKATVGQQLDIFGFNNYSWARYAKNGYEVSTKGDKRFSALVARLKDGRTIEEAYQLDIKGYRSEGNDWKLGKGKPPKNTSLDLYTEYKKLWQQWAKENPILITELATKAKGKILTDRFATTKVSQARTLSEILNDLQEDLDPAEQVKSAALLKSINNRIEQLELNIDKAEKRKDFKKVEELKDVLQSLIDRRNGLDTEDSLSVMEITRLADIATKGQQDMQEVTEMLQHKVTLEDTLYIRKVLHFWKTAKRTMFNDDDLQSDFLVEQFSSIGNQAERHIKTLTVIENKYMEGLIKKYGNAITVEDIFNHFKDINGLQRDFLDISRSDNPMLDSIFLSIKDANIDALDETREKLAELGGLENTIRPILKSLGYKELYEIYRQKTINDTYTGDMVTRYSSNFNKIKNRINNNLKDNNTFDNYKDVLTFAKKELLDIRIDYLFPVKILNKEEQEKAETYKLELKQTLGEKHYNEVIVEQSKLLEKYENFKQGRLEVIADKYNITIDDIKNDSNAYREAKNWLSVNSPYIFNNHLKSDNLKSIMDFRNFNSPSFIYQVPKDKKHYDNNFKTIENNVDLLKFYNYYNKIDKELKTYMSSSDRSQLAFEGIPYIEKVLFDEYRDKGMKIGLNPIMDGLRKSVRTNVEGTIKNTFIDPVTEIEEERLGVSLTNNTSDEYFAYINTKKIEYRLKNNNEPTGLQVETWKEEITDKLAQRKSYDLPKVLRVYALTVLAYKHKARIEDNIKLAQNILSEQREFERNSKGEILTDTQNRLEPKSASTSFINTKKQFDYFVQVFYGKGREKQGITEKKVYTNEEKIRLKNYRNVLDDLEEQFKEGKLTNTEYKEYEDIITSQINKLGGVAVWSKRGDAVLKYVQLKSMGWNLMSAIANIGFGFISNKIEGAGGLLYTSKQLSKAHRMVWSSLIKNWTFNKVETPTAKKIRSMMNNWDVLNTAVNELFRNPLNIELSKKGKWLTPYNLTERTEYLNQAPLMIALMMNTQVNTPKGKMSMWDAHDINGNFLGNKEESAKELKFIRNKIDQLVHKNHGNYDGNAPLRIKREFIGRALSQFRTWAFEGAADRFEKRKPDALLGIRKGRYISLVGYFKAVGMGKGTIDVIKGILNTASYGKLFSGLSFDSNIEGTTLEEMDAANMRKVMMEAVIYIGLFTSYFMLSTIAGSLDDEEDAKKKYILNLLLNQGTRLRTDLLFYIHPQEFRNLLRDPIPAASLIKDGFEWINAAHRFIIGDDEISTGVYSGHSRLLRETAQAIPFGTQIYKNINYSIQTFNK